MIEVNKRNHSNRSLIKHGTLVKSQTGVVGIVIETSENEFNVISFLEGTDSIFLNEDYFVDIDYIEKHYTIIGYEKDYDLKLTY